MTHDLKKEAVRRAMKMLDAAGAQYAIIIDDETFGTLTVATPRKRKNNWVSYPKGETREYYYPYIKDMVAGDIVEIPVGRFDIKTLASNVSAACIHEWGKGSTITNADRSRGIISVLRML